jgi:hypothetical protein
MTTDLLMKATGEYMTNNFWYIYSIIGAPYHIDIIIESTVEAFPLLTGTTQDRIL